MSTKTKIENKKKFAENCKKIDLYLRQNQKKYKKNCEDLTKRLNKYLGYNLKMSFYGHSIIDNSPCINHFIQTEDPLVIESWQEDKDGNLIKIGNIKTENSNDSVKKEMVPSSVRKSI